MVFYRSLNNFCVWWLILSSIKLFSTVGTTPIAVANSLVSHLLHLTDAASIDIYFIVSKDDSLLFSRGSISELPLVKQKLYENLHHFSSLKDLNLTTHFSKEETIIVTEHLLLDNISRIVQGAGKRLKQSDRVIFDITAGRKVMVASALLSCSLLHRLKPHCSYELAYYWLKEFTSENLGKYLYELGFDSYHSLFTSLEDIDTHIREVAGEFSWTD
ncbi:MAG: hypothetical protein ACTSPV_16125 [Candidatus Hodarchaeales archaeon]